jgi:hypothetical protein
MLAKYYVTTAGALGSEALPGVRGTAPPNSRTLC